MGERPKVDERGESASLISWPNPLEDFLSRLHNDSLASLMDLALRDFLMDRGLSKETAPAPQSSRFRMEASNVRAIIEEMEHRGLPMETLDG